MFSNKAILCLYGVICLLFSIIRFIIRKILNAYYWLHAKIYQPLAEYCLETILGVTEESVKSIVREIFANLRHYINAIFSWVVVFCFGKDKDYQALNKHHLGIHKQKSTLNWFLKREGCCLDDDNSDRIEENVNESEREHSWISGFLSRFKKKKPEDKESLIYHSDFMVMIRRLIVHDINFDNNCKSRHSGWCEDVHISFEIAITKVFEFCRQIARYCLFLPNKRKSSPLLHNQFSHGQIHDKNQLFNYIHYNNEANSSSMCQLPVHQVKSVKEWDSLLNLSKTASALLSVNNAIIKAGYPQEIHQTITEDGYILTLQRLPRKDATDVVFFQHGVFDTALGWVSSGVTGSVAFDAWYQGFDVWLGNSRSNPPRRHVNMMKMAKGTYWRYTLNELGIKDIGAQLEYIHHKKCQELRPKKTFEYTEVYHYKNPNNLKKTKSESNLQETHYNITNNNTKENNNNSSNIKLEDNTIIVSELESPYKLRVVGHSLGGCALLIYLISRLVEHKQHHISKMILLSPAGFHPKYPYIVYPLIHILPLFHFISEFIFGYEGIALIIPGVYTRLFFFKAFQDILKIPAIKYILKRSIRWLMNGDASPWEFALQLPHYDAKAMPGIALHTAIHLIQIAKSGKFQLFDFGSEKRNLEYYGRKKPLDLSEEYGRIDIPVDIVAGRNDGVIPPECVRMHYEKMLNCGVGRVTYKEVDYGHLEFCTTVQHDLKKYILVKLFE